MFQSLHHHQVSSKSDKGYGRSYAHMRKDNPLENFSKKIYKIEVNFWDFQEVFKIPVELQEL